MAPTARPGSKPGKIGRVVATLGCDIASGAFAVGAALPAEPDLERHYGASRGVVREAVKILAGKGLLSVGPRIGTRVRPTRDWNLLDHDVLGWLGQGGLDRELMLALDETRGIIEPAAASLAAERATAEDRRLIRQAYEDMAADPGDIAKATLADKAFHLAILDATHNPVLASFRTAIDAILTAIFDATVPMLAPNLPNHEAVALAIERGDAAGARLAMEQVLDRTHRLLTGGGGDRPTSVRSTQHPHAEMATEGRPRSTQRNTRASFEAPGTSPGAPQDEERGRRRPSRLEEAQP